MHCHNALEIGLIPLCMPRVLLPMEGWGSEGNKHAVITVQEHFRLVTVAERPGLIRSKQGPACKADFSFTDCPPLNILLVPGEIRCFSFFKDRNPEGLAHKIHQHAAQVA